ncbi:MAG: type II toxin-antitoxin system YafQ family toxin [Olsenella sp.]
MLKSIRVLPQFERDVKRLKKKHFPLDKLRSAVSAIFKDSRDELRRLHDHELKGNWLGYRELHIERSWLLTYRVDCDELVLVLVRTGSHDKIL